MHGSKKTDLPIQIETLPLSQRITHSEVTSVFTTLLGLIRAGRSKIIPINTLFGEHFPLENFTLPKLSLKVYITTVIDNCPARCCHF